MFTYSHVTGRDWRAICEATLAALASKAMPGGDLGFAYAHHTLSSDLARIVERLRCELGVAHWVGTVGLGVCSSGLEIYDEPSLAVMLTDIAEPDFRILPPIINDAANALAAIGEWRQAQQARFAVVHGDPTNPKLTELINQLAAGLDHGFLVGGLTSSEGAQTQIADDPVQGGLSGVLFSQHLHKATGLTQGCTLIGSKHEVTRCRGNVLIELDGRSALEVLNENIGEILARDPRRIGGYIFVALPIAGSDTGDYLVRNLIGIDLEHGVLAIGDLVEVGMAIQFAKRDAHSARADLLRMLDDIRTRLPSKPKGALYHSCLGRGRHLFGTDSAEMRIVADCLGEAPVVGFYANGEISHNRLYGYTGVLTVFC